MEPLARLANATEATLPGDDLAVLASSYADDGWRIDAALIEAVAAGVAGVGFSNPLPAPWVIKSGLGAWLLGNRRTVSIDRVDLR